jgi:hypothetical protein
MEKNEISMLADIVLGNDRGYCSAANCVFAHLGVSSPLGRALDRMANSGHYPGVLLLDLIPVEGWRYRGRQLPSPAALDAMAAAGRMPPRSRRKSPMPEEVREVVRGWLEERHGAAVRAAEVGRAAGHRSLVKFAGKEERRTAKALDLL